MAIDWITTQVLAVLFLATFVRATFGFGEALISVPLLALIMPVDVAAPVAVLVSITVAGVVLARDWRHVQVRSAGRLVLSTVVGTPLGLFMLTSVAEPIVKAVLGIVIVLFSLYCLASRRPAALHGDAMAWPFGFVAGVLGGAYGMNGPPLVMYGTLHGWSKRHFHATLQGYFLPASAMAMGGFWLAGLWTAAVTRYYLVALPVVIAAIVLGWVANGRMNERTFLRYVHLGLIGVGCVLLVQAVSAPARAAAAAAVHSKSA